MDKVCNLIRAAREARFSSQREFGRAADISNATAYRLETDPEYVPTLKTILIIEKFLGVDRVELVKLYFERLTNS